MLDLPESPATTCSPFFPSGLSGYWACWAEFYSPRVLRYGLDGDVPLKPWNPLPILRIFFAEGTPFSDVLFCFCFCFFRNGGQFFTLFRSSPRGIAQLAEYFLIHCRSVRHFRKSFYVLCSTLETWIVFEKQFVSSILNICNNCFQTHRISLFKINERGARMTF